MRRVFLSYRRDDSKYLTGFIYQHLEDPDAFGPGSVFMDIDDIPDGVDFRDVIDEAVGKCEFFLIVIGRHWVTPRLTDANDFVRLEIEAALRRKIPVTPVLVDGATMPREDELPPSLHPLRFKHARTIRHGKDFRADVLQMVAGLHTAKKWLADRAAASQGPAVGEGRDVSPPVLNAGDRMEILLPDGVPMAFAYCPPGKFLMGSPPSEEDREDDEQQHEVTLTKGFYMGVHPVTQAQYRAVMGTNPSHFKGDTLPVEQVSWEDAVAFCAAVKQKTGVEVRLPTEAKWEYAARGRSVTAYPGGDTEADLAAVGWYWQNSGSKTHPVGQKRANVWNLHDMHGNVLEWCSDWYDEGFYAKPEATKPDPECKDSIQTNRILRGGSWDDCARYCRAAARGLNAPDYRNNYFGFRVCVVLD